MSTSLQILIKKILVFSFFFAGIFTSNSSYAQVKFSVVCPYKTVGKGELLDIRFKVENGDHIERIQPPAFKDFNVVSGPNQESSMSSINGKVTQYVSIGFSLQPKSTGKFTIGPASAVINGKEYKTDPVTVKVTNATTPRRPGNNNSISPLSPLAGLNLDFSPPSVTHQFDDYILKPGENIADKTRKNLFLKLEVSKTSCYVGEPVVATYKLYTRLHSETTITDAPSFNGFSVSDLDVSSQAHVEKLNGRKYNVYTLRKVELYPLQSGQFTLDPVKADNKVTFIKSVYARSQRSDGFFDMLQNFGDAAVPADGLIQQDISLKTDPVLVTVKPLPLKDKPASFRGAVGDFSVKASLDKDSISTDDAGKLNITVSGKGNIQMINAPFIQWPKGVDGYEAKVKDAIDKSQIPMQGKKVFSFPFTVSKAGKYQLDSIEFSYFDPVTSSYKIIHTTPLEIKVVRGSGAHPDLKNDKKELLKESAPSHTEWILGILLTFGMLFVIAMLYIRRKKNKGDLEKNIKIDDLENQASGPEKEFVIPESPLVEVHEKLMAQQSTAFFQTLDAAMKKYLSAKFMVPASELSRKRLSEELDRCNVSLGTTLMLTSLMDDVEINLYAPPASAHHLNAIFEKASEVVSLLDKQVCSR